jgi:hypothetical protein
METLFSTVPLLYRNLIKDPVTVDVAGSLFSLLKYNALMENGTKRYTSSSFGRVYSLTKF